MRCVKGLARRGASEQSEAAALFGLEARRSRRCASLRESSVWASLARRIEKIGRQHRRPALRRGDGDEARAPPPRAAANGGEQMAQRARADDAI